MDKFLVLDYSNHKKVIDIIKVIRDPGDNIVLIYGNKGFGLVMCADTEIETDYMTELRDRICIGFWEMYKMEVDLILISSLKFIPVFR